MDDQDQPEKNFYRYPFLCFGGGGGGGGFGSCHTGLDGLKSKTALTIL